MGTRKRAANRRRIKGRFSQSQGPPRRAFQALGTQGSLLILGGVTYDTGALVAAERNSRRMWALHAGFLAEEVIPIVPAPVLAEAWRGGARQAHLSRLLALCDVEEMSELQARNVGVLVGKAGHDDVVDVTVVEGALRRNDGVVTSNEVHIGRVAEATGGTLRIESV